MEDSQNAPAELSDCRRCGQSTQTPIRVVIVAPSGTDRELSACPEHAASVALGPELAALLREATR